MQRTPVSLAAGRSDGQLRVREPMGVHEDPDTSGQRLQVRGGRCGGSFGSRVNRERQLRMIVLHGAIMTGGCNTSRMSRYGITVPFDEVPLPDHPEWFRRLADLGYSDVWRGEANAADGFTPLALAAVAAPTLRLGTAVVPVYTRGPGLLAVQAAALAELAPGRFELGVGSSSDVIVEQWNAATFTDPYQRVRDTVRFLRSALAGEKVTADYETFSVAGFKLARPVGEPPPILVAALRAGMLRLAGREAD